MPALPSGLVRHKNGRYYLRRRIPQDLLPSYPAKKEVAQSLQTSNYREALIAFDRADAKLKTHWDALRDKQAEQLAAAHLETAAILTKLGQEDIDRICQHYEYVSLHGDERQREEGLYDEVVMGEYQQGYPAALATLKAAVAIGDVETLGPILGQFLDLHNYQTNLPAQDFRRLAIAFGRVAIRTNEKLLRRFSGEEVATPPLPRETHHLSALVKDYLEAYDRVNHAPMFKKVGTVLPMFLDVVGDKPISSLRQTDITEFFALVQKLPPRWPDICRREKKTVKEVAQMALGEMAKGTFDGTYKAVITPFLEWAYTNWQDRGFPTTLTTHKIDYRGSRKEGEAHQRAFKLKELQTLFTGSDFRDLANDPDLHHQYWLPVIGLFSGARVNEICQLNPSTDILMSAAAWTEMVKWTENDSQCQVPQDESGRLMDVLWMGYLSALRSKGLSFLSYDLHAVPRDGKSQHPRRQTLILHIGPGDTGEAVLTIMLPGED